MSDNCDLVRVENGHPANRQTARSRAVQVFAFVLGAFVFFVLTMNRSVNIYDEGITLTGSMRVLAGQVPYRDFYYIYGPAQLYLLSAIFKIFGQSVLSARLVDAFIESLLTYTIYRAARCWSSRAAAIFATVTSVLWIFSLDMHCAAVTPVSLLVLWVSLCVLLSIQHNGTTWGMLLAGFLAGLATLFRPDAGLALLVIQLAVIWVGDAFAESGLRLQMRQKARLSGQFCAAFMLSVGPPLVAYLWFAGLTDIRFDLLDFPVQHYRAARALPFPTIDLASLDNLVLFIPLIMAALAAIALASYLLRTSSASDGPDAPGTRLALFSFGLLTSTMFLKAMVRTSSVQAYLAIVPAFIMLAIFFSHRKSLGMWRHAVIFVTTGISCVAVSSASFFPMVVMCSHKTSFIGFYALPRGVKLSNIQRWCKESNPLTRGACFVPDLDHIFAIEFLQTHTKSTDSLYVGLPHHDRVFANDNMIYFAVQRLPATKWSHFDPDLQNTIAIQQQMIEDIRRHAPPYIVLDSEFDSIHEPNDSSKSTGVLALDSFIRHRFRPSTTFGKLAIWHDFR